MSHSGDSPATLQPDHSAGSQPAASHAVAPAKARVGWIDVLRGVGIILVVIGHAIGGLLDAGAANANTAPWLLSLFAAIYVFHMPLFFFLAGIFVVGRIERSRERFATGIISSLVWPYILWSTIQIAIIWASGSLVNNPVDNPFVQILSIIYSPPSQFWFLYALILFHAASYLIWPVSRGYLYIIAAFAVASLGELSVVPTLAKVMFINFPYYAIGVVMGPVIISQNRISRSNLLDAGIVLAAVLAVGLAMWTAYTAEDPNGWRDSAAGIAFQVNGFFKFFAASLAISALILLSYRFGHLMPKWLTLCGRLTMPIFILHVIFVAGARVILQKLGLSIDVYVLSVVLVIIGICGPLSAYLIAEKLGISRKLGFG